MNANVKIQVLYKKGISYLGETYFTPPFRIANITEDKKAGPVDLMLMNSSPGVLDNDRYEIGIILFENANLRLHTQSYQRLFNMKQGAVQSTEVRLGKYASFTCLPHPSVPHEHSIFKSVNKIYLSKNSKLTWGEVLTCGRKLNGEIFMFSSYHSITSVYRDDKLVIKENLLIQPAMIDPSGLGKLEGFTHQASLICFNDNNINNQLDKVNEFLLSQKEVLAGITTTAGNGMLIRILGHGAEQLYQLIQNIAALLQQPLPQQEKTEHAY